MKASELKKELKMDKMPCGSPHSCLDCIHLVMVTDPCTYLTRMTDEEVDYFMDELRTKKLGSDEKIT